MKGVAASVAVTLAFAATGCAEDPTKIEVAADCSAQVRLNGVVYTSYGYTDHKATRYTAADEAECHDVGEDASGSVFPSRPRKVTTWTFSEYPPEKVLGVRSHKNSFAVFVAETVEYGPITYSGR